MPILGIIASAYSAPAAYTFWGASEEAVVASTDGISWDFKPSSDLYLTYTLQNLGSGNLFVENNRLLMNNQYAFLTLTTDGTTWDYFNNNASGIANDIIYQNSKYVALISGARSVGTSTDLITWTFGTIPALTDASTAILSLAYGNGTYVMVGENAYCASSTDAVTWTSRTTGIGSTDLLLNIIYGDKFVAVGRNSSSTSPNIVTSTDGITWTTRASAVNWVDIKDVAYDPTGGKYVAVGRNFTNDNIAQYSTDGITWTGSTTTFAQDVVFQYVTFANGTFVVTSQDSTITNFWTSTNGDTWTKRDTNNGDKYIYRPQYFSSKWWFSYDYSATGGGSMLANTTNFTTWTVITGNPTKGAMGVAPGSTDSARYMNSKYVFINRAGTNSSGVLETLNSTDLVTWTRNNTPSGNPNTIFYGNGTYVLGGNTAYLRTSTDLVTWTSRTANFGTSTIFSGDYGNSVYVIAGNNGRLCSSTDAVTWTSRTANFGTSTIRRVRYLNNIWVASGALGKISTSTDAVTWTARTSGVTDTLYGSAYGASTYICVGTAGRILKSTDGVTWSSITNPSGIATSNFNFYNASFSNSIFMVSGLYSATEFQGTGNIYFTSTDATTWTSRRNDKVGWSATYNTFAI